MMNKNSIPDTHARAITMSGGKRAGEDTRAAMQSSFTPIAGYTIYIYSTSFIPMSVQPIETP